MESNFLKENSLDNKKYFLEDTWNTFLNISTTEIGKRVTDGWFKSLKLISWNYNSKIAEINAPNEFVSKWILKNYKITIEKILARIFGEKNVYINVFFENTKTNFLKPASLYKESSENQNKGKAEKNFKNKIVSSKINSKNTFDKFFFGNDNEIAYSAAKYFLEKNDITYNSLFIHGASGTWEAWKFYLLDLATGKKIQSNLFINPNSVIRMCRAKLKKDGYNLRIGIKDLINFQSIVKENKIIGLNIIFLDPTYTNHGYDYINVHFDWKELEKFISPNFKNRLK